MCVKKFIKLIKKIKKIFLYIAMLMTQIIYIIPERVLYKLRISLLRCYYISVYIYINLRLPTYKKARTPKKLFVQQIFEVFFRVLTFLRKKKYFFNAKFHPAKKKLDEKSAKKKFSSLLHEIKKKCNSEIAAKVAKLIERSWCSRCSRDSFKIRRDKLKTLLFTVLTKLIHSRN